jgi:hypothetical protein
VEEAERRREEKEEGGRQASKMREEGRGKREVG